MRDLDGSAHEREKLAVYSDAYRDGHNDGFSRGWDDGYHAGAHSFRQRLLDCFADDDEVPERVAALLRS